jgi:O-antigen ligase
MALGATAALVTARAFWPSESDLQDGAGNGLTWTLCLLIVTGLAIASSLIGGQFRFRWSWTDIAFILLVGLVVYSAPHALDRRPAINLAWEWTGMSLAFLLYRNLPRTRQESTALAGVMVATAVAVAVYGIYQGLVELPELRAALIRDPKRLMQAMKDMNITPGSTSEKSFRDRLLGSTEAMSTFGLANSLAVFLVGPLVLLLGAVLKACTQRDSKDSPWPVIGLALPLILILLLCLNLTKSRSSYVGLFVGVGALLWYSRAIVAPRLLVRVSAIAFGAILAAIIVGFATGQFDRQVLTQAPLSLRYRLEYWQATWSLLTQGAPTFLLALQSPVFWQGLGPGNFRSEYLKYKLPQASEEILDPHNLFLEIWATAGFFALLALLSVISYALWTLLSARSSIKNTPTDDRVDASTSERGSTPRSVRWIIASAAAGWALAVVIGDLNPFQGELFARWLILGFGWLIAILLGAPVWRRIPIPASTFGAAVLAVVINLLAVGGIGIPAVALTLWLMIALGLNVQTDRPCGVTRHYTTRIPAFVLAIGWSAVVGTFFGTVVPFWKAQYAIDQAERELARKPPNFEKAVDQYQIAIESDGYSVKPWLGLTRLYWQVWTDAGAKVSDDRWKRIPILLLKAASPPRNPESWALHRDRAQFTTELLKIIGTSLSPLELLQRRGDIVNATRTASRLYPTNALLHAKLAIESAEISMNQDAVDEAQEALRLDRLNPHIERKLPEPIKRQLEAELPTWAELAKANPPPLPK